MTQRTIRFADLFEGLDPQPAFVAELERLGLLQVVARDESGEALYLAGARDELERVLELVDLGYQPKDIAAIAKRVGLPKRKRRLFRKTAVFLSAAELADKAGLPAERLEGWLARGMVVPGLITDRGHRLFAPQATAKLRLLDDLEQIGLEEEDVAALARLARRQVPGDNPAEGPVPADPELLVRLEARARRLRSASRAADRLHARLEKQAARARRRASSAAAEGVPSPESSGESARKPRSRRRRLLRSRGGRKRRARVEFTEELHHPSTPSMSCVAQGGQAEG